MTYRDLNNKALKAGDSVAGSFREDTVSVIRTGIVQRLGYTKDPQVMDAPNDEVSVAWVLWDTTSGHFLPKRQTRVATRKLVRVDS